ncbi:hypothetical protein KQX54_021475 [Cotesia glomerata]|uniref:Uncharacterized protein n=1 Tax=Cotesia glomerata TaxID=32391 RepID=A0AAV7J9N0_COTGL|nr:hypothetical protein KQX54_021475 [Cotesia glomerata]
MQSASSFSHSISREHQSGGYRDRGYFVIARKAYWGAEAPSIFHFAEVTLTTNACELSWCLSKYARKESNVPCRFTKRLVQLPGSVFLNRINLISTGIRKLEEVEDKVVGDD